MCQIMTLTADEKTGILYRKGTFDEWILKESRGYFPLGIQDNDVVLDIGGHIGCFAARARLENSSAKIISFEAEFSNYEVLKENAREFCFLSYHLAVTDNSRHLKTIPIYINTLKNNALHSLLYTRGRPYQTVIGRSFNNIIYENLPTIIKCDIEGGEFDLSWNSLLLWPQVRLVIIELHLSRKGFRDKARKMLETFKDMGFEIIGKPPRIGDKNWTTLAKFQRR